jgi:hypothetical protein
MNAIILQRLKPVRDLHQLPRGGFPGRAALGSTSSRSRPRRSDSEQGCVSGVPIGALFLASFCNLRRLLTHQPHTRLDKSLFF